MNHDPIKCYSLLIHIVSFNLAIFDDHFHDSNDSIAVVQVGESDVPEG
jgi:hypothetical protein